MSTPKATTYCPSCGRSDVGVVREYGTLRPQEGGPRRWRTSRHAVIYKGGPGTPICVGSRNVVDDSAVNQKVSA